MKKDSKARQADSQAAAAPRKPRGRPRSFDREAALDAAMGVFWEKGFEATSIADLTSAMGINPPSLYAAFGDKEKLYLEAVGKYMDCRRARAVCAFEEERTARAAIERAMREAVVDLTKPNSPRGCMLTLSAAGCDSADVQHELHQRRAAMRKRIRERIDQGIAEGDVPKGTDSAALADFFSAVFAGMAMQARDGVSRKSLLATVENAIRVFPEAPPKSAKGKSP